MAVLIQIRVSNKLFIKDPEETALGRKVVAESIHLIDELGMEKFTFKKLAQRISSTEASIYRYFKSKRHLLNYLFAYYWSWLEYRLKTKTAHINDPRERLKAAIAVLAESVENDPEGTYIDESILHRIVVTESDRTLLTRHIRSGEESNAITAYESLCMLLAGIIQQVNPRFNYPQALTITLIAATHRQRFYGEYFPSVTEVKLTKDDPSELVSFLELLAFSVLNKN